MRLAPAWLAGHDGDAGLPALGPALLEQCLDAYEPFGDAGLERRQACGQPGGDRGDACADGVAPVAVPVSVKCSVGLQGERAVQGVMEGSGKGVAGVTVERGYWGEPAENPLSAFVSGMSVREPEVLGALRAATAVLPEQGMLLPVGQGRLLALLARLGRWGRVLDVGTFTGYSALCLALALPVGGVVTTVDIDSRWLELAEEHWRRGGVRQRIRFVRGDGGAVLRGLDAEARRDPALRFGCVFVDADKGGYPVYGQLAERLLVPGGLLVADNTLWRGAVVDPGALDGGTLGLRAFARWLARSAAFEPMVLPVGNGVTVAVRK